MRFSFIPNGLVWQQFVTRLFVADRDRPGSPVPGFRTVSAERLRDYGLDGIEADGSGTIYQMYLPLWEAGEPRHKRINEKLEDTCRKLKENAIAIKDIIGTSVKKLILVIPEDPDVKIRQHERLLKKRYSLKIAIWGEAEIASMLSRHTSAVKDLLPFTIESVNVLGVLKEADIFYKQGPASKARELYEKAEFYAILYNDTDSRRKAKEGLAGLAYELGDLLTAEKHAEEAIAMSDISDLVSSAKILINNAQIKGSLGKHSEAEKSLTRALSLAKKAKKTEIVAEIQAFQGRLALGRGDLKKAKLLLKKSLKGCKEQGGSAHINALEFNAALAREGKDFDAAIKFLREATDYAQTKATPMTAGKLGMRLAELLVTQKRFSEARDILQKTESFFRQDAQETDANIAKTYIAKTFLFEGKFNEAEPILLEIVHRASEMKLDLVSAEANLLLADVAVARKEWQRALDYAETGLREFTYQNHIPGKVHSLLVLGRIAERASEMGELSGMTERAEEYRLRARQELQQASSMKPPPEVILDAQTELARSKELTGKFEESIAILKATNPNIHSDAAKRELAREIIDSGVNRCTEKIRVRDLLKKVKEHSDPLQWAQTKGTKTIQEAHVKTYATLLEWMDVWPDAKCELLDFWGRGNFLRLLLNQQATEVGDLPPAFTLCVEVTTVEEAETAIQILYPIVDSLVLIWKGAMEEGLTIVPQHEDYEGPGGWGYITCAGDLIKPKETKSGIWHPAVGWARPLPREIVDFIFIKARPLVERGRLILVPASLIGCEFRGHGYFEKLLIQELLHGNPIMMQVEGEKITMAGFPLVIPYFPQVPLDDLAKIVDDHEDVLLQMRIACLEWGKTAMREGAELSEHTKQIIIAQIKSAFSKIDQAFRSLSGKMPSQSPFLLATEPLKPSVLRAPTPKAPASVVQQVTSSALYTALQSDALTWYPFWQIRSRVGGFWRIAGPKLPTPKPKDPEADAPESQKISTHWIQPPQGGWTIPTAFSVPIK